MAEFSPDAADDALRDALALIRAGLQDDPLAVSTVAAHLSWPESTAALLGTWLGGLLRDLGMGQAAVDRWQERAGLR